MLYLLFLWWHGAFEGPLTAKEIDFYVNKMKEIAPERDPAFLKEMLGKDTGKPLLMVNAMKYRDEPIPVNGKAVTESSAEILKKYSYFVGSFLIKRGSYPIYVGEASGKAVESWGIDHAENWSIAAIVRYRSVRTLMELATNSTFRDLHDYKIAALEKTFAFPTKVSLLAGSLQILVLFMFLSFALAIQLFVTMKMKKIV